MENFIGQHIGRYKILDLLGQGGMASVYKAYDSRLEREVAIKIIRRDSFPPDALQDMLQRFDREAKALARLSHPNIVKVLDYGEYEGSPFLVLEYLPGGTLTQKVGAPMHWKDALQLLLPVVRGVEYAHKHEIIHRDIKPANILMSEVGHPTLSDFGIIKLLQPDNSEMLTATGMAMGTPVYMAPEQWTGKTSARSDMYSLGVILYELITGYRPYTSDTPGGVFLKQVTEPVRLPSEIIPQLPEPVEQFLLKVLSKDPERRYADLGEFIKEVEYLLESESPSALDLTVRAVTQKLDQQPAVKDAVIVVAQPHRPRRQWILVLGIGFVLTAALAAVLAVFFIFKFMQAGKNSDQQMVLIPAGEFTMGSNTGDADEKPVHKVYMDAYSIDKYEVTNAAYEACVTANVCNPPLDTTMYVDPQYADTPVVYVNWNMAKAYCEWRGAQLPTEAQWEKAARGTDGRIYPWGNSIECTFANYGACSEGPKPVGSYPNGSSPYGVFDMAGNVYEWVQDYYSSSYYALAPLKNPPGPDVPESENRRIIRGGSFGYDLSYATTTRRFGYMPNETYGYLGFRCASGMTAP